jgi:hypothetical protein
MGLSTLIFNLLPQGRKADLINRKNVKIINEFLKERKKQQTAKKDDLERLKELRNNRSIDGDTYHRLKNVMILTHEKKRIELIDAITSKSFKRDGSVKSPENWLLADAPETGIDFGEPEDLEDASETQSEDQPDFDSTKQ